MTRPSFMPQASAIPVQEAVVEPSITQSARPSFMKPKKAVDMTPVLKKWSYSAWSLFKELPYALYARDVMKLEYGSSGPAAERGTAMHAELEQYVVSGRESGSPDAVGKAFLDGLFSDGYAVQPEKRFSLDREWKEVSAKDRAMMAILDVLATAPDGKLLIADYKSGRRYDLKHTQQAQLYAAVSHHVLGADECDAKFIYLDGHGSLDITFNTRTMKMAVDFWRIEGERMLTAHKAMFAPPDSLDGIPKYYHGFLCDPNSYNPEHFSPPWYARG